MPMKRAKRRILFGLNRQVAKGLSVVQNTTNNNNTAVTTPPPYPCHIVNRFECPYDYEKDIITTILKKSFIKQVILGDCA